MTIKMKKYILILLVSVFLLNLSCDTSLEKMEQKSNVEHDDTVKIDHSTILLDKESLIFGYDSENTETEQSKLILDKDNLMISFDLKGIVIQD